MQLANCTAFATVLFTTYLQHVMLFHYNYFKKHCHVGENISLKFSSGVLFNFGLFYHKSFRDVNNVNFISNVIGRKSTKFIICNGLVCFELALGRLRRSNQVKSKKD